ncbi:MAG TPA: prepilin-type N-terminal cleavage/methylation domain-containing protein [Pseudomonas sp.]|nr:prepilin-type N-terminal cleavage/methylation domain-containing protein [Pseudomonas sp.]
MNRHTQRGFTLLELVVVIVIVGLLATVALPRLMNATGDAQAASVNGTAGALAAGVAMVRAQWELNRAKGRGGQNNVAGFGEGDVDVNELGWPVATASGPGAQGCAELWRGVLLGSAPRVAVSGTATYLVEFAAPLCRYRYQRDTRRIEYDTRTGAVTVAE